MKQSANPASSTAASNRLWLDRAAEVLAGGVSSHFRRGESIVFSHGQGSRFWDVEGRAYLDFTLSQGPLIHGHSPPAILERVGRAMARGQVYSGIQPDEVELAEKITRIVPCAELVRFSTSGSEAVHAALRLARAYTGRPRIIKFEGHYHGWYDTVAGSINPPLDEAGPDDRPSTVPWTGGLARGALDDLVILPWNEPELVERTLGEQGREIAAVITEPCMCNSGCIEPRAGYLQRLRALCDRYGVLLIFDEVITGFRLALGGGQEYYGVTPDLAVFGKAVAGGFPISVLAGRREVMQALADGRTIHAGTLNAHSMCVAACLACIELLEADNGAAYKQLYERTGRLMQGLRAACAEAGRPALIQGPGPVFHMGFLAAGQCGVERQRAGATTSRSAPSTQYSVRTTEDSALNPQDSGLSTQKSALRTQDSPALAPQVRNYRDVVRTYDPALCARFVAGMLQRGVRLIGRGIWYTSTAHSDEDVETALNAARIALSEISIPG